MLTNMFRNMLFRLKTLSRAGNSVLNGPGYLPKKATRQQKALFGLDPTGFGLEIGPSYSPVAPKKQGFRVHILDHINAEELRKKYAHTGLAENIEEVDFVWKGQPLTRLIGQQGCYDWIIAGHVVEHVPDLVSFLQQCQQLLKPGGKLSLIIPDKRVCFDYFSPVTTTGDLLDAFEEKCTLPSPGKVFDHFSNACKRSGQIAWTKSTAGEFSLVHSFEDARHQWLQAGSRTEYIDIHCWRFTPESFCLVSSDLNMLGLINMGIVSKFETEGSEFFVTLCKGSAIEQFPDRLGLLLKLIK